MDEEKLIRKLRLIESIYSGATTAGEKAAAARARDRILERLRRLEHEAPPVEFRFSMPDMWSRKVFVALLRRYGIRPYRYRGQRHTTVMARIPQRFVNETLWPEFQGLSETLHGYLSELTDRVVQQVIHQDSSDAEVIEKPKQLSRAPLTSDAPPPGAPQPPGAMPPGSPGSSGSSTEAQNKNRRKRNRKKRKRR